MKRGIAAALAAVLALSMTGASSCGGGDSGTTDTAATPKAHHAKKHNKKKHHKKKHHKRRHHKKKHHKKVIPPPTTATTPPTTNTTACDPSYKGACLDPNASDYDCEGGSGNGPEYVSGPITVVGDDHFGLDRDGDGTACE